MGPKEAFEHDTGTVVVKNIELDSKLPLIGDSFKNVEVVSFVVLLNFRVINLEVEIDYHL